MDCHNENVEALGNNALPYCTVARWVGKFQQGHVSTSDEQRRDGRSVSGSTWQVPSSSSSWMKTDDLDNKQRQIEKRTTNASTSQLCVLCCHSFAS
ncbi:hypothetical protein TNCT_133991 [Trichonephila clavata]|uniref:Transposase n=1 Tax=Trichonephila clavata TaxID=2740835 RepID=A0A8X6LZT4_TRICU|nr:hypothetical protein TNCT_133991 [Trichonephila clavata]